MNSFPRGRRVPPAILGLAAATASILAALGEPTALEPIDPAQPHLRRLAVPEGFTGGPLHLKGPLPSISKVWMGGYPAKTPLEFGFSPDATEVTVYLPKVKPDPPKSSGLQFLITENTTTHPGGVVVLSALDSKVIGTKAKLETHPGNHRIGFWGKAEDFVQWTTAIPAGDYDVELAYSRASPTGTEISITFDEAALPHTLATTGSWYRYRVAKIGKVSISKAESHRVEARVTRIVNGGVMNLKALILTPRKAKP